MLYLSTFDRKCLISVFLTKNVLFGYFWDKILKQLLSYLKSATPNKKTKTTKFETINALIGYFWARTLKS